MSNYPNFSDFLMGTGFLLVFLGFMAVLLAIVLVCYIFQGIGLYQIAKRRGLENEAFWAWIPIGAQYVMGKLAERSYPGMPLSLLTPLFVGLGLAGAILPYIGFFGGIISLAGIVFQCISLYYIYKELSPGNEVLHTVLSAIVPTYSCFALFALRNR